MYSDNCPICTEGLRALLWLVEKDGKESDADKAVRRIKQERALTSDRLEMAFGHPVDANGIDFSLRMEV